MKMNRIMIMSLVVAVLVVGDGNAAWSRAGQFARKVAVSGTGLVAAAATGSMMWTTSFLEQQFVNHVKLHTVNEALGSRNQQHQEVDQLLEVVSTLNRAELPQEESELLKKLNAAKEKIKVKPQQPKPHTSVFELMPGSGMGITLTSLSSEANKKVEGIYGQHGIKEPFLPIGVDIDEFFPVNVLSRNQLVLPELQLAVTVPACYSQAVQKGNTVAKVDGKKLDLSEKQADALLHRAATSAAGNDGDAIKALLYAQPALVLLPAKIARVAGKSRLVALGAAFVSYVATRGVSALALKQLEKGADRGIPTSELAHAAARVYEDAGHFEKTPTALESAYNRFFPATYGAFYPHNEHAAYLRKHAQNLKEQGK